MLTIRYKSELKIETVQATGTSKTTDSRWCLNEPWSVGCRNFSAASFYIDQTRKEKYWFLEKKRVLQSLLCLRDKTMDQERKRMWIQSLCVSVFLPEWVGGGRGGLRDWLSSAGLVEGFLVWYCLTVTNKASCFDLVTVEIHLILLFWKLVGSFHYFITYAE